MRVIASSVLSQGTLHVSWYKASAFNQSFEGHAWFRVKRSYSCFPGTCSSTKVSEPVPNRMVTTYLGTDTRARQAWMDGYGFNYRVGLAVRWVMDGQGGGPSTSQCGGHTQLQCWTGQPCDPGNQPYNGGCYACGTIGQACCLNWSSTPTPGGWMGVCAQRATAVIRAALASERDELRSGADHRDRGGWAEPGWYTVSHRSLAIGVKPGRRLCQHATRIGLSADRERRRSATTCRTGSGNGLNM
jgi:hypothetical protein